MFTFGEMISHYRPDGDLKKSAICHRNRCFSHQPQLGEIIYQIT